MGSIVAHTLVFCSADDKKPKEMVSESDLEKDLSRKTVVVTGGNSGIGRETAKQLFKQGATVKNKLEYGFILPNYTTIVPKKAGKIYS